MVKQKKNIANIQTCEERLAFINRVAAASITTRSIARSSRKVLSKMMPPLRLGCIRTRLNREKNRGAHITTKHMKIGNPADCSNRKVIKKVNAINNALFSKIGYALR